MSDFKYYIAEMLLQLYSFNLNKMIEHAFIYIVRT